MSIKTTSETDQTAGVVTLAAPWRVKALTVLLDYCLAVTFQDGKNGVANFSSVLTTKDSGIFESLKDKDFFEQASLVLGAVTWPNGADIDPAWMYEQVEEGKSWLIPF
jgi:hypothetical protein